MSIQGGEQRILDCRCVDTGCVTVGPPIQLFNPAFAYFTSKAFVPEHDVPPAFICRVRDVVESFALIHPSEFYRRGHLTSIIQDIVGCPTSLARNVDGTSSDRVVVHTAEQIVRYPVMREEQRELGGGHSTQAVHDSRSQAHYKTISHVLFVLSGKGVVLNILNLSTLRHLVQHTSPLFPWIHGILY
ncbi:hypothetical protein PISMIDRAFT_509727 [Pisolithus microcarpus 441]|uniref:Uncharacterized protein n=1 Tax=Pisolithus microcarpus 441 TaxID=765257 RepID=A0A0C9YBR3_9AGAM|nr:hypothetical protein PISMIDRAFT_509727 [Pisolithus microcarpus 441]